MNFLKKMTMKGGRSEGILLLGIVFFVGTDVLFLGDVMQRGDVKTNSFNSVRVTNEMYRNLTNNGNAKKRRSLVMEHFRGMNTQSNNNNNSNNNNDNSNDNSNNTSADSSQRSSIDFDSMKRYCFLLIILYENVF